MQRYNFFYNNVRLLIAKYEQSYQTKTIAENCLMFNPTLDLADFFSRFLSDEQNFDLLYANEIEEKQIKKAIYNFFIVKRAAGGIVFKDNAILTIFRFSRWDFPKGHIEAGETDADAALREVTEETGISELIIEKDLNFTYHIFKNENDRFVLKKTHWYQMRTSSENTLVPQTEEQILTAKWLPFSQWDSIVENTYPTIVELLAQLESKGCLNCILKATVPLIAKQDTTINLSPQ